MLEIITIYIKTNLKHMLLGIITLALLFFLFGLYVDEIMSNYFITDYMNHIDANLYWSGMEGDIFDKDICMKFAQKDSNVGYARKGVLEEEGTQESYLCWYVSPYYSKQAVFIDKGRTLSYDGKENEVVIFGEQLRKKYAIGDTVVMNDIPYKVVGYVTTSQPLLDLFFNSRDMDLTICDMVVNAYDYNIFLTNNQDFSEENLECISFLTDTPKEWLKHAMSFKTIKQNTSQVLRKQVYFQGSCVIMLIFLMIYSIVSFVVIQYQRCGNLFAVYHICGMSDRQYQLLCFLLNIVIILGAVLLFLILFGIFKAQNKSFSIASGNRSLYLCFAISVTIMLFSYILNFKLYEKTAMEIIRRFE